MLDKSLVPSARTVYEAQFGPLRERRGWAQVKCIFHDGNSKSSLGLNLISGGFNCFSCGAKGGDLISFVRLRDGVDFQTACRTLGCWRDGSKGKIPRGEMVSTRHLLADLVIDSVQHSVSVPDEPKNLRQALRQHFCDARDRLHEIRNGGPEQDEHEEEDNWEIMQLAWELLEEEDRKR